MRDPQVRVWILEDDEDARFIYRDILDLRFSTRYFGDLRTFSETIQKGPELPDLLVADLRLGDGCFLDFLESPVGTRFRAPFVVVSSIDDLDFYRASYQRGASDFITKPFSRNELIAKIERALALREAEGRSFRFEPQNLRVGTGRHEVDLTAKELKIFTALNEARGTPVAREAIYERVWQGTTVGEKSLEVHISKLRQKLATVGLGIQFVPDQGYSLKPRGS